jgi:hypothetical protein
MDVEKHTVNIGVDARSYFDVPRMAFGFTPLSSDVAGIFPRRNYL